MKYGFIPTTSLDLQFCETHPPISAIVSIFEGIDKDRYVIFYFNTFSKN